MVMRSGWCTPMHQLSDQLFDQQSDPANASAAPPSHLCRTTALHGKRIDWTAPNARGRAPKTSPESGRGRECSRGEGVGDHPLRRRRPESRPGNGCLHCRVERRLRRTSGVKRFDQGTHNFAEYHALILGLRLARKHGARKVVVKGDSTLVVKQVNGEWKTKHPTLQPLRAKAVRSVGAVRRLVRQVDPARGEPARRRAGSGVMRHRTPCAT